MNCQDCKKVFDPYLDGELAEAESVSVGAHRALCTDCDSLFRDEQNARSRVKAILGECHSPSGLHARLPALIERADRRLVLRRTALFAVPAVAASLAVFFVLRPPKPHGHSLEEHGPGVQFAVDHFLELGNAAASAGTTMLDPELLRAHCEDYQELDGARLNAFYRQLFGDQANVPPEILAPRVQAAALNVNFKGTPVNNLILDLQDRSIGVYRLRKGSAALNDLHVVDEGVKTGLRIERCRSCYVIAVTRGEEVFILVSKDGVEPMIELVRQTF